MWCMCVVYVVYVCSVCGGCVLRMCWLWVDDVVEGCVLGGVVACVWWMCITLVVYRCGVCGGCRVYTRCMC